MTMAKQQVTFQGTLEQLKDLVDQAGLRGQWRPEPHAWHFRRQDGAGMHWSSGTGTVWFDGPIGPREKLAARMTPVLAQAAGIAAPAKSNRKTIEALKLELLRLHNDVTRALRTLEQVQRRSEPDDEGTTQGPKRRQHRW